MKIKIEPMVQTGAVVQITLSKESKEGKPTILTLTNRELVQLFATIGKYLVE